MYRDQKKRKEGGTRKAAREQALAPKEWSQRSRAAAMAARAQSLVLTDESQSSTPSKRSINRTLFTWLKNA